MILRSYLNQSALLLEGVENLNNNSVVNVYCGLNVSKTDTEPIDQIQFFTTAKRIQEWNLKNYSEPGLFIVFIGGLFETLNSQNSKQLKNTIQVNFQKEKFKTKLLQNICTSYQLNFKILTTLDLWQDQSYWNILKSLFDQQIFTRGLLINDVLKFYESKDQLMQAIRVKELPQDLVNLPLEFIKKIGNYPAPILYTPAEVTEALYLRQKFAINTKVGQAQERTYDKYLYRDFSILRLRQPTALDSNLAKVKTVTPYIDKNSFSLSGDEKSNLRFNFNDDLDSVSKKIKEVAVEESVYNFDEDLGEVFNPIVEKTILAIESARVLKQTPVRIGNQAYQSGQELVNDLLTQKIKVSQLAQALPQLITKFILRKQDYEI